VNDLIMATCIDSQWYSFFSFLFVLDSQKRKRNEYVIFSDGVSSYAL
jgi:hypothetical protein